jgi:tetratricopeptide (TPR) repeat protein
LKESGQRTEALALYKQAIRHQEQARERDPKDVTSQSFLAHPHQNLGTLLAELGRHPEAEDHVRKALDIRDKLLSKSPDVQGYVIDQAETCGLFGTVVGDSGRPQEALDWCARAIAALEGILAKEQRHVGVRKPLCRAYRTRAQALDLLGRYPEAVQDWERALKLDNGKDRPVLQLGRAISQAHVGGDSRQGLAEAETLAKDADGPTLERLARLCALASAAATSEKQEPAEAADLREQYAARAVALLRQAIGKGYRDRLYLREGTDVVSVRQRADFQKLLAGLEDEAKTRAESLPAGKEK